MQFLGGLGPVLFPALFYRVGPDLSLSLSRLCSGPMARADLQACRGFKFMKQRSAVGRLGLRICNPCSSQRGRAQSEVVACDQAPHGHPEPPSSIIINVWSAPPYIWFTHALHIKPSISRPDKRLQPEFRSTLLAPHPPTPPPLSL